MGDQAEAWAEALNQLLPSGRIEWEVVATGASVAGSWVQAAGWQDAREHWWQHQEISLSPRPRLQRAGHPYLEPLSVQE